jgi:hypothetical protein
MVEKIAASVAQSTPASSVQRGLDFQEAFKSQGKATGGRKLETSAATSGTSGATPSKASAGATGQVHSATAAAKPGSVRAPPGAGEVQALSPAQRPGGAKFLGQVQQAQSRLDQLLKMAESGRTFSPAELLAFQAHTYRASQELDMASKVVEKGTSAVKQTLQTQI